MKRCFALCLLLVSFSGFSQEHSWIRINLLGYPEKGTKVAIWCSKQNETLTDFVLLDAVSNKVVFSGKAGKAFGAYGPFAASYRLNFSAFVKPGKYVLKAGNAVSPVININNDVYKGTADFCLRYMRQQRSGFNPYLKDSCHTHDGYTLYGPMPDSTHIDVSGGWHDASDYLQYSTTTANAVWHLLAAYRDFPGVFRDKQKANGLDGKNGVPDILDEARWGLDWLLKMHPRPDWLFNQLGDDRDHMGMRIPKEDSFYGRGFERPVYFVSGEPQQRGKFMNASTGTSSTAAKFASAFVLGATIFNNRDDAYTKLLVSKAETAYAFALKKPGVSQTASVRSPYIYAEDNWADDMELAETMLLQLQGKGDETAQWKRIMQYARKEPVTPWMADDTAKHYQWYPFINLGHREAAMASIFTDKKQSDELMGFYRKGIEQVWARAKQNAFYRGVPFIWCSNNLTVSFAMQCAWYKQLSGDRQFGELEQANFDWLFGCNPWGTSMVYGLPANGDTPVDPHSAFTHLKNYPIDGGLVDGPVYTSIYKNLIGIHLVNPDEYAEFQSDLAVYHDDYGDYSTNEPTMDGTASLIYLLALKERQGIAGEGEWVGQVPREFRFQNQQGGVIRSDSTKKQIALVFTGDEYGDGLQSIANTLEKEKIKGSFYFTGRFYRNKDFETGIKKLHQQKHLMGMHSDQHLLYADWSNRNKTLVTKDSLFFDLGKNEDAMEALGIDESQISRFFIPPYEWWNAETAGWLDKAGYTVFSFTPGTTSNADYTYPEMGASYKSSETIMASIKKFNKTRPAGLNGVVLLIHAGTDPRRKDKLYDQLGELINYLKKDGYSFKRVDELFR